MKFSSLVSVAVGVTNYANFCADYRVRVKLSDNTSTDGTQNFLNVSATKVVSINDAAPNQSNWAVLGNNGTLLLFGRPVFAADDSTAAPGLFLLRQALPLTTTEAKNWTPQYYTGRDAIGRPSWSSTRRVGFDLGQRLQGH